MDETWTGKAFNAWVEMLAGRSAAVMEAINLTAAVGVRPPG